MTEEIVEVHLPVCVAPAARRDAFGRLVLGVAVSEFAPSYPGKDTGAVFDLPPRRPTTVIAGPVINAPGRLLDGREYTAYQKFQVVL